MKYLERKIIFIYHLKVSKCIDIISRNQALAIVQ